MRQWRPQGKEYVSHEQAESVARLRRQPDEKAKSEGPQKARPQPKLENRRRDNHQERGWHHNSDAKAPRQDRAG